MGQSIFIRDPSHRLLQQLASPRSEGSRRRTIAGGLRQLLPLFGEPVTGGHDRSRKMSVRTQVGSRRDLLASVLSGGRGQMLLVRADRHLWSRSSLPRSLGSVRRGYCWQPCQAPAVRSRQVARQHGSERIAVLPVLGELTRGQGYSSYTKFLDPTQGRIKKRALLTTVEGSSPVAEGPSR